MQSWRFWSITLIALGLLQTATWLGCPVTARSAEEKAVAEIPNQEEGKEPSDQTKDEKKEDECPSTFGPIVTDTAVPIDKGKFAVQPTWSLAFVAHNFSPSWRRVSAGGDYASFGTALKLTYGLFNNLEVYTVIPFIQNWANRVNTPGPNGETSADFGGLGDINFNLKYRLVAEGSIAPTVSFLSTFGFPSGHFRHLNPGRLGIDRLGGGSFYFTNGFNLSKYIKPVIVYANLWYSMKTDYITDNGVDENGIALKGHNHPRDTVTLNLAMEWPFAKKWVALLELYSNWDAGRLIGPKANLAPTARLTTLPGLEYMATEKMSFAFGVGIDLIGKNTTCSYTPMLSMVYSF
jgi:hypothetical protein